MKETSPQELKKMQDDNEDFLLIDVREHHEYESANIGGKLIPLGTLLENLAEIPKDKPVVMHCRSGSRSAAAIMELTMNHGYENLINLKGGIKAWADAFDPAMPV